MIRDWLEEHKPKSPGRSKIKSACWIAFNQGYHQNTTNEGYEYIKDRFDRWFAQFESNNKW
jgi:hypothetical protein